METLKKYESKAQEEVPEEGDFGAISTKGEWAVLLLESFISKAGDRKWGRGGGWM